MGQIVRVSCEKCDKSEELYIGGGFSDCNFETVISGMSNLQKDNLREAKHLGAVRFSINRVPCICQSCNSFYTANKVSYILEGEKKIIWSRCPSCSSFKKKIISTDNKSACTVCGQPIKVEEIGLWD